MQQSTTVAVVLVDGAPLFESSVPLSVFGVDRSNSGVPRFELLAVAAEDGPVRSTAGIELRAPHGLDAIARADIVVVPSWRSPNEIPPAPLLDAVRYAHDRGAITVSLCMGAFVLAATGLLDGRRAATHWLHAPALAARYPAVRVDPDVLYVDDGDVLTSAGTAAGLDACLHLVRRLWGSRVAATIARRMVIPPHRSGGQAQYIDQPVPDAHAAVDLSPALSYALSHLDQPLDVDTLAALTQYSRRSFDRRFRAVTGLSPLQWLLQQRILRAQRLLEDTDLTIDVVAARTGFTSGVSLRPHFRRQVGISPNDYRELYRGQSASPAVSSPGTRGDHS